MRITRKELEHWVNHFYGYGSWDADFWLVAHEEGGGDLPDEVADRFNYFSHVHASATAATLCDIRDLYQHVGITWEGPRAGRYKTLYDFRFGPEAVVHGVWKNLVSFVYGYKNEPVPDLITYQKSSFVSPSGSKEALMRLFPLPSPHDHGWYYSWLDMPEFPFLKSRSLYQDHVYDSRIQALLKNISEFKPQVVLMYGMSNINSLKGSFQKFFPSAKFKMEKAVKLQIPQHHWTEIGSTTILITTQIPALRHNRIETGFDWEAFGKGVRGVKRSE